jgi:hypothetical protein
LVRIRERKEKVGRPSFRWDDKIKMSFKETGFQDMNWVQLAQDLRALVNTAMNLRFHRRQRIS